MPEIVWVLIVLYAAAWFIAMISIFLKIFNDEFGPDGYYHPEWDSEKIFVAIMSGLGAITLGALWPFVLAGIGAKSLSKGKG